MRTIAKLSLATLFSSAVLLAGAGVAPLTGSALAQMAYSSRSDEAGASVTVVMIRQYFGPEDFQQVPRTYRYPSAQTYARGQEEVRSNAKIRALLLRRGIPFERVSGVQTAFNGGKIVYVK